MSNVPVLFRYLVYLLDVEHFLTNLNSFLQDFFGKMKNKAENMEMIIKEKDKHGKIAS